ncbi:MAG: SpoIIE family protein phosphatase, partial [Thermoanaerobaculia bacterium]|nr:SpoIIE family protein phosphatase [Thermoanaerobaculia bacterium]
MQRLFDQEASQAFRTLADRPGTEQRTSEGLRALVEDVLAVGRGMVLKLSPARRVLFVAALICPILAALAFDFYLSQTHVQFDASPFWYLLSIAILILLLALELVDRLRVRDELEVARQLQSDLLPQGSPDLVGWRISHSYRTANEIGGDYYDFLPLPDGRMAIAVADASGHGIGAGLLMAIGNAALETAVDLDPRPLAVMKLLGRTLYRTGGRRAF